MTLRVAMVLLCLLAASGCSHYQLGGPATTIPTPNEAAFLTEIRGQFVALRTIPDKTLIDLANGACHQLRTGATARDLATQILSTKPPPALQHAYAGLLRDGVDRFCPDQSAKLA